MLPDEGLVAVVTNSDPDFWRRSSRDLGRQRPTPFRQSPWTLILHNLHFHPCREWPIFKWEQSLTHHLWHLQYYYSILVNYILERHKFQIFKVEREDEKRKLNESEYRITPGNFSISFNTSNKRNSFFCMYRKKNVKRKSYHIPLRTWEQTSQGVIFL